MDLVPISPIFEIIPFCSLSFHLSKNRVFSCRIVAHFTHLCGNLLMISVIFLPFLLPIRYHPVVFVHLVDATNRGHPVHAAVAQRWLQ